ncbi:MAG TPA: hypothetical protein PLX33_07370 [Alphaproteobacteria bacterium]|nr:hypothetical protein [Alphaproteobacteria bacterium]
MFGFGKKEEVKLVGAKRKLEHAKKFNAGYQVKSKREGKEPNPRLAAAIVWAMAVAAAVLLSEAIKKGETYSTGNQGFDKLMFGATGPSFAGSPEIDYVLLLVIRGTIIFMIAGIIPGLTLLWQRIFDKAHMNVYIGFWGVTVGLGVVYLLSKGFLSDVAKQFSQAFM